MSQRAGLDKRQAEGALNAFVDAVMDATKGGERVAVLGFGTFKPTSRGARTGRNPQTGAPVKIAASKGVRFAPWTAFMSALNTKGAAKKGASARKAAPATKAGSAKAASATKAPAKKATKSTKKK